MTHVFFLLIILHHTLAFSLALFQEHSLVARTSEIRSLSITILHFYLDKGELIVTECCLGHHFIPTYYSCEIEIISPFLMLKKLRPNEFKALAWAHTASKQRGSLPGFLAVSLNSPPCHKMEVPIKAAYSIITLITCLRNWSVWAEIWPSLWDFSKLYLSLLCLSFSSDKWDY